MSAFLYLKSQKIIFWDASALLLNSAVFSFLLLNSISLWENTTTCLSIFLLMEIWIVSSCILKNKATVNICVQIFVWHIFSLYLGKHFGFVLLSCIITVYLICMKLFSKWLYLFLFLNETTFFSTKGKLDEILHKVIQIGIWLVDISSHIL